MNDTRYGYSEKAKTERKRIMKNDFICGKKSNKFKDNYVK